LTFTFILVLHPVEAETINYELNIAVDGYGTISPAAGSHFYETGCEIAVYVTDAYSSYGWLFDYWLLDGSIIEKKNNNPLNIVMDRNHELTAVFAQAPLPFPTIETTPSPAASPEPHEIPEFPFWVIIPLFTITALLVAIFQFNNRKRLT